MSTQTEPAIHAHQLQFRWSKRQPTVLDIPELRIDQGERVFLFGPSGSGKTTLLNLLAGVTRPTSGQLHVMGEPMHRLSGRKRDHFRAQHIGIVFQQFNLIPYLTVTDNVRLAAHLGGKNDATCTDRIHDMLRALGLSDHHWRRPAHALSVGQQQRVAVARALINSPQLFIADEPSSALDSDHRDEFMHLMMQAADQHNSTVIFVSHDRALQSHFSRHLDLTQLQRAAVQETA
ncbi:ABC transporter ATP-binding protein [Salinispirillum marinum]|uniref:ABC transporter ATP-binding protein n=2 Tax=Saccharospirillaceae TaxID=255527 RepID=A0ABV8BCK7_9GAMM